MLTTEEEAIIVAFRKHTLLPLDDCLYALQENIPHLTHSSLHRCFQRHDISRLPEIEGDKQPRKKFRACSDYKKLHICEGDFSPFAADFDAACLKARKEKAAKK